MKKFYQSILGAAVGAALLSGCSSGGTVGATARLTASKTSPLKLDAGASTDGSRAVTNSYLNGHFMNCAGRSDNDRWDLSFTSNVNDLRVALNDAGCELWADSVTRRLDDDDTNLEVFTFYDRDGVDGATTASPILIEDGYTPSKVRVAYRTTFNSDSGAAGLESSLVNIAGTHVRNATGGDFTEDFHIALLTGTTAQDIEMLANNPSSYTSVVAIASQSEFEAPDNVISVDNDFAITVDGNGFITGTAGNFLFTADNSPGTSYVFAGAGQTLTYPSGSDAERYNYLRTQYSNFDSTSIMNGDFSISVGTLFPTGTRIFDRDTNGVLSINDTNNNFVIVRREDADSAVASYKAITVRIQVPGAFPAATLVQ